MSLKNCTILFAFFLFICLCSCKVEDINQIEQPIFSPIAGEVDYRTPITISCNTTGATIYYTTNGDDPTIDSIEYSDTNKPLITGNITIKAIAVKENMEDSVISESSYTIAVRDTDVITITDKGNYYEVIIDYTKDATRFEIGVEYYKEIIKVLPNFESLIDSYFAYRCNNNAIAYNIIISRIADFIPQIKQDYIAEIDGLALEVSGGVKDVMDDRKLSRNEVYALNLVTDVGREHQCSFVSAFGTYSETGNTIVGRNLDWSGGDENQLPQLQCVTIYKNNDRSICTIGYLGYMAVVTGFNNEGIFASILDAPTENPYSSIDKHSYVFDLREALENYDNIDSIYNYMLDRNYAYGHLISISDSNESKILENDLVSTPELRTYDSTLHPGVTWSLTDAICSVNAFMLNGKHDNFTNVGGNVSRWNDFETQLINQAPLISVSEIKKIISYDGSDGVPGYSDIYNLGTQQTVVFQPHNLSLEVAFHPKDQMNPYPNPIFETVSVSFD
jgi:hypothetical protein